MELIGEGEVTACERGGGGGGSWVHKLYRVFLLVFFVQNCTLRKISITFYFEKETCKRSYVVEERTTSVSKFPTLTFAHSDSAYVLVHALLNWLQFGADAAARGQHRTAVLRLNNSSALEPRRCPDCPNY